MSNATWPYNHQHSSELWDISAEILTELSRRDEVKYRVKATDIIPGLICFTCKASSVVTRCPHPDNAPDGATTVTKPNPTMAFSNARMPGASTPSSFVNKIFILVILLALGSLE